MGCLDRGDVPRMTGDGPAYVLVEPDGDPKGGVVILHAAGSRKESHVDFAQGCAAAGLAVIAFDQRAKGASDGALAAGARHTFVRTPGGDHHSVQHDLARPDEALSLPARPRHVTQRPTPIYGVAGAIAP